MGNGGRLLVALGALALVVALFFVIRAVAGDDGDDGTAAATTAPTDTPPPPPPPPPPPGPQEIRVNVPAGGPTGVQRATVGLGDQVVLIVRSGVSDHVHLHGYDLIADVGPGQPARISFEANTPGRFEAELEDRGVPILDLRVTP